MKTTQFFAAEEDEEKIQRKEYKPEKVNPLKDYSGKVITFYSTYYSDKISALDLTTNEGLLEMIRLAEKANITPLTNEQAEFLNSKQQHEIPPQKAASIYSVSGMTGTIVKGYTNAGQVVELYNTSKHNQKHIMPYDEPKWYEYNGLEGSWDGANYSNITPKDVTVGLGVVGVIVGAGTAIAAGTITVVGVMSILNSLDDAIGGFVSGDGSLAYNLTSEEEKQLVSSVKAIVSFFTAHDSLKNIKSTKDYKKALVILDILNDFIGGLITSNSVIEDDEK